MGSAPVLGLFGAGLWLRAYTSLSSPALFTLRAPNREEAGHRDTGWEVLGGGCRLSVGSSPSSQSLICPAVLSTLLSLPLHWLGITLRAPRPSPHKCAAADLASGGLPRPASWPLHSYPGLGDRGCHRQERGVGSLKAAPGHGKARGLHTGCLFQALAPWPWAGLGWSSCVVSRGRSH